MLIILAFFLRKINSFRNLKKYFKILKYFFKFLNEMLKKNAKKKMLKKKC